MPSRAIVNYMYEMTQLGATPQQIEAGLTNAASLSTIFVIVTATVLGLSLLLYKLRTTH